jgi:uncharacterized membrane protein YbhN (UPF0104 family)
VLAAIGLSVLLHGLLVTSIYLFGLALLTTSTAGFEEVLFAAPVAMLTMILPLPAGGLGVGELAFDQVLITAATVKGAAGVFLFFRCLGMLLNLVGLPFYLWNKRVRGNAPS